MTGAELREGDSAPLNLVPVSKVCTPFLERCSGGHPLMISLKPKKTEVSKVGGFFVLCTPHSWQD